MDFKTILKNYKKYWIVGASSLVLMVLGFCIGYFALPPRVQAPPPSKENLGEVSEKKQSEKETKEPVAPAPEEKKREPFSKTPLMKGIDVSKWQGKPDWKKIAASGVEFAMIRIGYHGSSGSFGLDPSADHNLKGAAENGVLAGIYFYSLAKNTSEAEAEALWVLERAGEYEISLPVVIDYEMMENDASASAAERTEIALTFLRIVQGAGYDGMLYVPINELNDPKLWEKDRILEEYMIWGADYGIPDAEHPDSETNFAMWQYSDHGRVSGISGNVDLNFAYFTAKPQKAKYDCLLSEAVTEHGQIFTPAKEYVTAKIRVNLRKSPSVEGELVADLKKGEYLLRVADGADGWSRLDYKGQTVYAVTSYLMDKEGQGLTPAS
ncbi:MAG: hypothetical protein E7580_05280 [Ruminococcaceae bacterium]|nr:hypothetical protein [Oscillospiraceae bacterium]